MRGKKTQYSDLFYLYCVDPSSGAARHLLPREKVLTVRQTPIYDSALGCDSKVIVPKKQDCRKYLPKSQMYAIMLNCRILSEVQLY